MSSIQPLQIQPNQLNHYKRILEILKSFYFYIDGSNTGLGKTFVAAAIAITLKLPCIVFCPKGARQTWRDVFTKYGVSTYQITETRGIITYESLRSVDQHQPKHGLLTRNDFNSSHPTFYPTELLTNLIQAGVFIIFDEAQKLKNDSDQHKAASTIMHHFYTLGSKTLNTVTTSPAPNIKSRFALLSASLVDKPQQVIYLMEMIGFISGSLNQIGIQDIINKASKINPSETNNFILRTPMGTSSAEVTQYVYQLFVHSIRPIIMSSISPLKTSAIKDVRNGYYNLTPSELSVYKQGINKLIMALKMRNRRKDLRQEIKLLQQQPNENNALQSQNTAAILQFNYDQIPNNDLGDITNALIMLQESKMNPMIRVTRYLLSLKFNYEGKAIIPKIVLFADYYKVIDYLMLNLAEFNPVELTGRTSEQQRTLNVNSFQEPNDRIRLLIGNPQVGGLAISLHDVTGLFPRFMFLMPNYDVNESYQATGRTFRSGVKGVAITRFFYGKSDIQETSILDSIARKGEVLQQIHIDQSDVIFPNQYPDEDESEFMSNFMTLFAQSQVETPNTINNNTPVQPSPTTFGLGALSQFI